MSCEQHFCESFLHSLSNNFIIWKLPFKASNIKLCISLVPIVCEMLHNLVVFKINWLQEPTCKGNLNCRCEVSISKRKMLKKNCHLSLVCFKIGKNSKTGWYYVLTRVNTDWTCSKTFSTELAGLCSVWTVNLE